MTIDLLFRLCPAKLNAEYGTLTQFYKYVFLTHVVGRTSSFVILLICSDNDGKIKKNYKTQTFKRWFPRIYLSR